MTQLTKEDWEDLVSESPEVASAEVTRSIQEGKQAEALMGLATIVCSMAKAESRTYRASFRKLCCTVYQLLTNTCTDRIESVYEAEDLRESLLRGMARNAKLRDNLLGIFDATKATAISWAAADGASNVPDVTFDDIFTQDLT